MSDGTDGTSAAQLAAGAAQSYMNNAMQYATQASTAAATASQAANQAAQASASANRQAMALLSWLNATGVVSTSLKSTDSVAFSRLGSLYSVSYGAIKGDIQTGLLQATNNLDDVSDPDTALSNLNGVSKNAIKSSLVTNVSSSATVSTTFSFTPSTDGVISVIAQGGSAGTTSPSIGLEIAADVTEGCTLLNENYNNNGSYNMACYTGQFQVSANVPVTIQITQTAPTGTTSNNLSSFFICLPG